MTGEPIETPDVPEVTEVTGDAVDAVTETAGEAAASVAETAENAAQAAQDAAVQVSEGVDSAVDAAQDAVQNAAETVGESANYASAPTPSVERRFDPMTGEPIDPNKAYVSPVPPEPTKSGFNPKFVIFGVIGLAIIAAIVAVLSLFVFSKRVKVERAVAKTMSIDSALYKDCKNLSDILKNDKYSAAVTFDGGKTLGSASGTIRVDGKDKQIALDAEISQIPEFSILAGIDKESVKLEVPEFSDYLFVYNYTEDKSGYLVKMAGDETIDALDAFCGVLYNASASSDDYVVKVAKLTRDYEKKLKWKNAEARKLEVNDKKIKCKGYKTTIDKDMAIDFWDEFSELYLDEYEEYNSQLKKLTGTNLKDTLKDIKTELKSMPDIDITFYIYKGQLACINVDAGKKGGELDVFFKGGDFRAQNILIEADGDEVFELKGSKSKEKENYTMAVDGEDVLELTYNTKNGTLELEVNDGYDSVELECEIKSSDKQFTLTADELDLDGMDMDFSVDITKSVKMEKYTNDEEFDLGEADEDDFTDLIKSLDYDDLGSLAYLFY